MERLKVKAEYKKAIKNAQRSPHQTCWNRLHSAMSSKNSCEFWKSWKQVYNKNKSELHPVVNGVTDKGEIASSFASHFAKVSQPNNAERVETLKNDFHSCYHKAVSSHHCDCDTHRISLQSVLDAAFSLKRGKCSDDEKVSAEHFFEAPLILFDRLQGLFVSMLQHAFVPAQF